MFDIGFSELLIIAVVALVVLGPERLPKAARFAGLWVRRARAQWYSVKSELERDLAAEELRRSLHDTREAMRGFGDSVRSTGSEIERGFDEVRDGVRGAMRDEATPDQAESPHAPAGEPWAADPHQDPREHPHEDLLVPHEPAAEPTLPHAEHDRDGAR
jgi:sec-independent protein translocase protein TatB